MHGFAIHLGIGYRSWVRPRHRPDSPMVSTPQRMRVTSTRGSLVSGGRARDRCDSGGKLRGVIVRCCRSQGAHELDDFSPQ